jgi:hypothetical protein
VRGSFRAFGPGVVLPVWGMDPHKIHTLQNNNLALRDEVVDSTVDKIKTMIY